MGCYLSREALTLAARQNSSHVYLFYVLICFFVPGVKRIKETRRAMLEGFKIYHINVWANVASTAIWITHINWWTLLSQFNFISRSNFDWKATKFMRNEFESNLCSEVFSAKWIFECLHQTEVVGRCCTFVGLILNVHLSLLSWHQSWIS